MSVQPLRLLPNLSKAQVEMAQTKTEFERHLKEKDTELDDMKKNSNRAIGVFFSAIR